MLDLRLAVTDSPYGDAAVKVTCPVHNDPSASLAVYPDNIHCYGCGFHRNNLDEALAILLGITPAEAFERLDSLQGAYVAQAKVDLPPLPTGKARMYHRFLREQMSQRLEWLYARGLTDATIDEALLGHDGFRFTIPVFDQHNQLVTLRFRKDDTVPDDEGERTPKYSGMKGRNQLYLYGANWLAGDTVIVTEGELDALRLWQTGLCAVSATNGAGRTARVPALLRELSEQVDTIVAATDADAAGDKAAVQTAKAAEEVGCRVKRLRWLEGKDVTEALCKGSEFYEQAWTGKAFGAIRGPISLDSLGGKYLRYVEPTRTNGGADVCVQHYVRAA